MNKVKSGFILILSDLNAEAGKDEEKSKRKVKRNID